MHLRVHVSLLPQRPRLAEVAAGRVVLVHCLRGENRSGAVCAAYLAAESGDPEDAVAQART